MMNTTIINHLKRESATHKSHEFNVRNWGNVRESTMSTVVTCYHYKNSGHKVRDYEILIEKIEMKSQEKSVVSRKSGIVSVIAMTILRDVTSRKDVVNI